MSVKADELPTVGPSINVTTEASDESAGEQTDDSGETLETESLPDGETAEEPVETSAPAETEAEPDETRTGSGMTVSEYLSLRESQSAGSNTVGVITERNGSASAQDVESELLLAMRLRRLAESSELNLIVFRGDGYVNVRGEATVESDIVGKMRYNAVAEVLGTVYTENGLWYHIRSGSVDGYVKSEFFVNGYEAADLIKDLTYTWASAKNDGQRVYRYADIYSDTIASVSTDKKYQVVSIGESYVQILYASGEQGTPVYGYIPVDLVEISYEASTAQTLEEEEETIREARRIAYEMSLVDASRESSRQQAAYESSVAESLSIAQSIYESQSAAESWLAESRRASSEAASRAAAAAYESWRQSSIAADASASASQQGWQNISDYGSLIPDGTSDLRRRIVLNALQYVNVLPYVWGGESLQTGTDCSGFLMLIFRQYGIDLPHYSYYIATRGVKVVSMDYIRPGDIICYNTWNPSSGQGHVVMFVGYAADGTPMIVEAPTTGLKVRVKAMSWSGLHTIQNVIGD